MSIAPVLANCGCQCSASVASFRATFQDIVTKIPFNEEQLGKIIVMVSQPSLDATQIYTLLQSSDEEGKGKSMNQWNVDVVAEVLSADTKAFDWSLVVRHLDQPTLKIRSEQDFLFIVKLVIRMSGKPLPAAGLMGVWENMTAQLAFLVLGANLPRNVVDFSMLCTSDCKLEGEVPSPANYSWMSVLLYKTLISIATRGMQREVLDTLVAAASNYPEYVTVGLAQVQDPSSGIRSDILRRTLTLFTALPGSRPSSIAVMKRLYEVNQDLLVILCRSALKRATNMQQVYESAARLRSLGPVGRRVEEEGILEELIGYWCVLSDRGEVNLEEKLTFQLAKNPQQARILTAFAKQHAESLRSRSVDGGLLSYDSCAAILRVAKQYPAVVPGEEIFALASYLNQRIHSQQQQQPQQTQRPIELAPVADSRGGEGESPAEVEVEANAYFQKIYTADITIPEIIQLLKKFKAAPQNSREQEIFRCMIHNLFDECRFFHKYPEKELQVTGRLFGSLIQHQLVSSITLGIALRYVLEALGKDPDLGGSDEKMFRFGKISLDQFRSRLPEWPQYCSHLIQIPHLAVHCPEVFSEAQRSIVAPVSGSNQPPSSSYPYQASAATGIPTGRAVGGPEPARNPGLDLKTQPGLYTSAGGSPRPMSSSAPEYLPAQMSTLSLQSTVLPVAQRPPEPEMAAAASPGKPSEIDRMMAVNIEVANTTMPPENIRDQIHFIVNNIAKANADEKSLELKGILIPDYYNWFANYLVVKRISTQPNLHPLYSVVLDLIESSPLLKTIMISVYHNVTKLLQSPKITTSSSERSLLRNLGSWLGQMTLARNKPLLQRRINLKELVLWGYETGRLIAVCSFVAKILEGARDSKVFRPPNPWLMALLGVMRELYELEDLKINIKFEVQVLCKNINIKIEDIPRGNVLSLRRPPVKNQFNQDFTYKGPILSAEQLAAQASQALTLESSLPSPPPSSAVAPVRAVPVELGVSDHSEQMVNPALQNISAYININGNLQYFTAFPAHRKLVTIAVERAIQEVIQPVVERSVTIACVTTRAMVTKDFSAELNEGVLLNAAQLMVSSLTSSLSLVTCKEPLRLSIGNHLRSLLAQVTSDQASIEQVATTCASDNVELGCILIEKAATERARRDIKDVLSSEIAIRKHCKEVGQPLPAPTAAKHSKYPRDLPDYLKPRVIEEQPSQQIVYDSFQRPRITMPTMPTISYPSLASMDSRGATVAGPGPVALSMAQALEEFEMCLVRVDNALKIVMRQAQGREVTLSMLGTDHEILVQLREMIVVTQKTQPAIRVETAATYAESVFKRFSETLSGADTLRLEVVVGILEALRDACGGIKKFAPDLAAWLSHYTAVNASSDEAGKKVHRSLVILLMKARLIQAADVDIYLATFMDGGRNLVWVEIALDFVRQGLAEGLTTIQEFPKTFDIVSKMRPTNAAVKKQLQKWLTDLRALAAVKGADAKAGPPQPLPISHSSTPNREQTGKEQVLLLIDRWLRISTSANESLFGNYLQLMHQYGVLKTEEAADRFFRLATELCVEACLKTASESTPINFTVVDALAKLFLLLVRLADKEAGDISVSVSLLARILNAITRSMVDIHEAKKSGALPGAFDQRPYYRLFSCLTQDLGVPDSKQEPNPSIIPLLTTYSQVFLALQPSVVPGFAFGWLQLISHRSFMPQLMLMKNQKGWPIMHRLLMAVLLFLQPFLKHVQMTEAVRKLYRSTLRVLLVVLHDFPEFLSDYHLSFCDAIPSTCVQLRNLVLSAFPRTMRLPDPFTPNLKVDLLPEINQTPRILSDYLGIITERGLRQHIDTFLSTRQPADFPNSLANMLATTSANYSLPLITALVIYVGGQAISQQQQNKTSLQSSLAMEVFRALLSTLDYEGRYHILSAMVNQLRFPNSHTHYFSCVLLVLFGDADAEALQEQITRVLLERLIVHRPHPVSLFFNYSFELDHFVSI